MAPERQLRGGDDDLRRRAVPRRPWERRGCVVGGGRRPGQARLGEANKFVIPQTELALWGSGGF